MNSNTKAYFFAFGAILLWSTVATAFKIALESVSILNLLFFSSLTAFICLAIILIFERKPIRFTKKSFLSGAIRGFLNPFLYYLILLKAYSVLPAQEAMSLNYIWPLMLVLLSVPILGQKLQWAAIIGLLISFLGVLLIATHGQITTLKFENPWGAFLAISSSLVWALFWLANLKSKESETFKLFISFGFGAIYSAVALWFFEGFTLFSINANLAMAYIGLAEMGIAFYFWLKALQYAKRTDMVSNLIYIAPFLSLLFIHFILHEPIGFYTFSGLILILLGIILSKIGDKNKKINIE